MAGGQRMGSGSPYGAGSPLAQKVLGGSGKRLSFGGGASPLGQSWDGIEKPATPTGAGKASVGLNSKWLYERGRGSPNGRGLFS